MERNETFLVNKSLSWNVPDCKKKLFGPKSEQDAKAVPRRLQILPQNLAPPSPARRPKKLREQQPFPNLHRQTGGPFSGQRHLHHQTL